MSNYEIKFAGFEDAMNLKDALTEELANSKFSLNTLDLSQGSSSLQDMDLDVFLDAALRLDSSKTVRSALFKCLESSLYNGEKITVHTFDDIKAVENYYQIMVECVKVNLTPFFQKLASHLTKFNLEAFIDSQKSN